MLPSLLWLRGNCKVEESQAVIKILSTIIIGETSKLGHYLDIESENRRTSTLIFGFHKTLYPIRLNLVQTF